MNTKTLEKLFEGIDRLKKWIDKFQSNGLTIVTLNNKRGLINEKGEEIAECKYNELAEFDSDGLAEVKIGNKWGLINERGEWVETISRPKDYQKWIRPTVS